jgi:pimeloyl-ACP methyl ester carboxylesterase
VLRYDDRGVGKSTGSFATATSEDFARDAQAAVAFLKSRREIDAEKIGIAGHSEGGLIAPIVATKDAGVAFLVLMAGPGVPGRDVVLHQGKRIGRAMGLSDEQVEATAATNAAVFDIVAAGGDAAEMRGKLEARLGAAWDSLGEGQRGGGDKESFVKQQLASITSPWFRHFLTFDPRPVLAQVTCPVLAINGEKDLQVDPKQNLPEIEKALQKNADVTCLELPGLNHLFQTCKSGAPAEYGVIEETFAPRALTAIADWICKRFGR